MTCERPIIGFDTEDGSEGPESIISGQFVSACGRIAEYVRRHQAEPFDAFQARLQRIARGFGPVDLWACNAWYDANNLGLVSRGVTASRSARMFTNWRHPAIGAAHLYDTVPLVPAPLAKLGEAVGLEKLPIAPNDPAYAMRDAEIVAKFISQLREGVEGLIHGAGLKPTAGATASGIWRAMGGRVEELPEQLHATARHAYRGGRTEVIRHGKHGAARIYDLTSAFPAAMVEGGFYAGSWEPSSDVERPGLYDVTVLVDEQLPFGPLPVRVDGATVYPVGRFRGIYHGEELADVEGLTVERVHGGFAPELLVDPFREYVDGLYLHKRHGSGPVHLAAKTFLNSLYGILGQGGMVQGLMTVTRGCRMEGRILAPGVLHYQFDKGANQKANPAWSGLVTARVRRKLYHAMLEVADDLLYVDTDCLVVQNGAEPSDVEDRLGAWKLEADVDAIELVAPKVYAYRWMQGWSYKAKGIARHAAEEFVHGGRAAWRAPLTLIQAAVRGDTPGAWRDVERTIRQIHQQRAEVGTDGETRPWRASELDD